MGITKVDPKRKRGAPKGHPKHGGRKKGTPNKATADVKAIAQLYTKEAIELLAGIMRDKNAFATARVSAAKELLDRGHGKTRQALDVNASFDLAGHLARLSGWSEDDGE
jgi:hypothetical protein